MDVCNVYCAADQACDAAYTEGAQAQSAFEATTRRVKGGG
jgi:hypothetical protein